MKIKKFLVPQNIARRKLESNLVIVSNSLSLLVLVLVPPFEQSFNSDISQILRTTRYPHSCPCTTPYHIFTDCYHPRHWLVPIGPTNGVLEGSQGTGAVGLEEVGEEEEMMKLLRDVIERVCIKTVPCRAIHAQVLRPLQRRLLSQQQFCPPHQAVLSPWCRPLCQLALSARTEMMSGQLARRPSHGANGSTSSIMFSNGVQIKIFRPIVLFLAGPVLIPPLVLCSKLPLVAGLRVP
mmetsp:Transcript_1510/g.1819  ORF Transcript_1510/g.1819 Transcript_1510/m.1819 type:complete len:237 (+) Transcript_1510:92-802(+)